MRLFHQKRGTEKPIEIFIALFIILAVAMVILKMFSGQVSGKTKELEILEKEQKLKESVDRAKQNCDEICTDALQSDCSSQTLAQFCITYVQKGLDLDGNGVSADYDDLFLGGLGICEDRVYCPHLTTCKCNRELTMANCAEILCGYWESQGLSTENSTEILLNKIQLGECSVKEPNWYSVFSTQLNCSLYP